MNRDSITSGCGHSRWNGTDHRARMKNEPLHTRPKELFVRNMLLFRIAITASTERVLGHTAR